MTSLSYHDPWAARGLSLPVGGQRTRVESIWPAFHLMYSRRMSSKAGEQRGSQSAVALSDAPTTGPAWE
ncbi:hypothetical protein E2C01_086251 [Portunus trituberculatus]|uniref:Uncharacterized protein n=1 Tax=Portunus trituberculatus TaxID=210409 RepID=A0A5B7JCY0_PORTR|nr:hypothetical protein [Portunus trituberculatus]